MTIILTIIAAVLVIIGLVVFNVRRRLHRINPNMRITLQLQLTFLRFRKKKSLSKLKPLYMIRSK